MQRLEVSVAAKDLPLIGSMLDSNFIPLNKKMANAQTSESNGKLPAGELAGAFFFRFAA